MKNYNLPVLGGGVGLRNEHFEDILKENPQCGWFEIIAENFLGFGGYARETLQEISKRYRIIGHGVCLSIGSSDPLDIEHVHKLKGFLDDIGSPWFSDHLCFTMVDHANLNDLIPLPFTEECATTIIEKVRIVQDILERPFLLENVTRYLTLSEREMSEIEFIGKVVEGAQCGLLLDVTNAYLNAQTFGFDPYDFIRALPLDRVGQMHLSGWEPAEDGTILDSHDAPVPEVVWSLFKRVLALTGPSSVLVEWDSQLPDWRRLLREAELTDSVLKEVCNWNREDSSAALAVGA